VSVLSHSRGHSIYFDENSWRYSDTGNLIENEQRVCVRCGKPPTAEGFDACKGYVKNATSVCCGHGVEKEILI